MGYFCGKDETSMNNVQTFTDREVQVMKDFSVIQLILLAAKRIEYEANLNPRFSSAFNVASKALRRVLDHCPEIRFIDKDIQGKKMYVYHAWIKDMYTKSHSNIVAPSKEDAEEMLRLEVLNSSLDKDVVEMACLKKLKITVIEMSKTATSVPAHVESTYIPRMRQTTEPNLEW